MFPGVNPRQMAQMMKKMGIQQVEIPAQKVIIECPDKNIIILNPQVSKVNVMGQQTYQIIGEAKETPKETKPSITEEDIKTIVEQTSCSEEQARKALEETKGDLAEAILKLKK